MGLWIKGSDCLKNYIKLHVIDLLKPKNQVAQKIILQQWSLNSIDSTLKFEVYLLYCDS